MKQRVGVLVPLALVLGAIAARGEEPRPPLARRIREANARATRAIAARLPGLARTDSSYARHARTLAALALLRAGGPAEREAAVKALDEWWKDAQANRLGELSYANYQLALGISALEGTGLAPTADEADPHSTLTRYEQKPLDAETRRRIEVATKVLLRGASCCGRRVAWGYGIAPFETTRAKDGVTWSGPADLSNTQFAVLALHDAARAGIEAPDSVVRGIVETFRGSAARDKDALRWGYLTGLDYVETSSKAMTFAALSSLAIARDLGAKEDDVQALIQGGLAGLGKLVRSIGAPRTSGTGWGTAYDLYSAEKALDLLDVTALDGKDWFAPLAEGVLACQDRHGLWNGDVVDSCFLVLFLVRATVSKKRLENRTVVRAGPRPPGVVVVGSSTDAVDATALLRAWAEASTIADVRAAATRAEEAMTAVLAEGGGREACLLGGLATLASKGGSRREAAERWTALVAGRSLDSKELASAGETFGRLATAKEPLELRAALARSSPLPLRAFAASVLVEKDGREHADAVVAAIDALENDAALETEAGSRCARALAAAAAKLTGAKDLPELSKQGIVRPAEVRWLARVARDRLKK